MEKKEKKQKNKAAIWLTTICSALALAAIGFVVYLSMFQKIDKAVIYQDGKALDKLDATVVVIPGTTKSYDVNLRARMGGTFRVFVNFEGTPNSLTDLITCQVKNDYATEWLTLTEFFNAKETYVTTTLLDNDKDSLFTVTYYFDPSIEASSIKPIDFSLSFTIKR